MRHQQPVIELQPIPLPEPAPIIAVLQAMMLTGRTFWRPPPALDPLTGCDCYGVIWYAFSLAGITLPVAGEEAEALFVIVQPPYQPFDVMLARCTPVWAERHAGVFLAPRWGFHCSKSTNGLARFSLDKLAWQKLIHHGLRYRAFCAEGDTA